MTSKSNKLNNKRARDEFGPVRPQDIISMNPDKVKLVEVTDKTKQAIDEFQCKYTSWARLKIYGSQFKCWRNYIFLGEEFSIEFDKLKFSSIISPNAHVHIFLNDCGCNQANLLNFCEMLSCVNNKLNKIIIHASKSCRTLPYIKKHFQEFNSFNRTKVIIEKPGNCIDFWCADFWDPTMVMKLNLKWDNSDCTDNVWFTYQTQYITGIRIEFTSPCSVGSPFEAFALNYHKRSFSNVFAVEARTTLRENQ